MGNSPPITEQLDRTFCWISVIFLVGKAIPKQDTVGCCTRNAAASCFRFSQQSRIQCTNRPGARCSYYLKYFSKSRRMVWVWSLLYYYCCCRRIHTGARLKGRNSRRAHFFFDVFMSRSEWLGRVVYLFTCSVVRTCMLSCISRYVPQCPYLRFASPTKVFFEFDVEGGPEPLQRRVVVQKSCQSPSTSRRNSHSWASDWVTGVWTENFVSSAMTGHCVVCSLCCITTRHLCVVQFCGHTPFPTSLLHGTGVKRTK